MKLKLYLILVILTASLSFLSFSRKSGNIKGFTKLADTTQDYLYRYGEYIYNRENCNKCHTLNQTQDENLLSLDGLKGKYPKSWHYAHLVDPQHVVVQSEMPSFSYLSDRIFTKVSVESKLNLISNENWIKELEKVKNVKDELKYLNIEIKDNTEILALIYFLDNIPVSKELEIIHGKRDEKFAKNQSVRDSLWDNIDSAINMELNDKQSIIKGQKLYETHCTPCHGLLGQGFIGPNLTDKYWINGGNALSIANSIINGIPDKGMVSWRFLFTPTKVGQLVAFIKSIQGSNPPNAKEEQGSRE